ncbi:MAG: hypothetical protein AVDCRST_MAG54-3158 [uncultured Actinomycetospora sp.]|uniref:Uncharacterized protein n=1 Tax=uncultured Actinomycetospora sp. TaxID=1135996 RepID=A0A6J4JCF9_9PSEU|nr:MAG: hypothetical protein AVDCRST_MAG54-3158 [uncultured Actinomycetospora sp.]
MNGRPRRTRCPPRTTTKGIDVVRGRVRAVQHHHLQPPAGEGFETHPAGTDGLRHPAGRREQVRRDEPGHQLDREPRRGARVDRADTRRADRDARRDVGLGAHTEVFTRGPEFLTQVGLERPGNGLESALLGSPAAHRGQHREGEGTEDPAHDAPFLGAQNGCTGRRRKEWERERCARLGESLSSEDTDGDRPSWCAEPRASAGRQHRGEGPRSTGAADAVVHRVVHRDLLSVCEEQ